MHPAPSVPSAPFPSGASRVTGLRLSLTLAFHFNNLASSSYILSCVILNINFQT